jgi:hypothetical protein
MQTLLVLSETKAILMKYVGEVLLICPGLEFVYASLFFYA